MSTIQPPAGPSVPSPANEQQRLRGAAKQLEGVFVEQLFKAMRETVPNDGLTHGGAGEDMFTGLLDQHLSESAPGQWQHGIGEALFRQLSNHLPTAPTSPNSTSKDIARNS
jgi:peptidoglycan hydrolase FlgJ